MSADSSFLRNDDEYDRLGSAGGRSKERVLRDLRALVNDAERLLRQAADSSSDTLSGMRAQFGRRIDRTRESIDSARRLIGDKSRAGTEAARGYVREKPLASVGVATA